MKKETHIIIYIYTYNIYNILYIIYIFIYLYKLKFLLIRKSSKSYIKK